MAYDDKNLMLKPSSASWGTGQDKVLQTGEFCTTDAATVVETANYFNGAAKRIPDGGVALVNAVVGIGGTIKHKKYMLTRAGAVVTAALLVTAAG